MTGGVINQVEYNNKTQNINKTDTTYVNRTRNFFTFRALIFLLLWYFFSGCTLFLNKYILTYLDGNPTILGKHILLISIRFN